MRSAETYIPDVVIVHGGGIDPAQVLKWAGIEAPCTVHSFTDMSPQNTRLKDVAFAADHLLLEDASNRGIVDDSIAAYHAQAFSSKPHTTRVFTRDSGVTEIISAPGYDPSIRVAVSWLDDYRELVIEATNPGDVGGDIV